MDKDIVNLNIDFVKKNNVFSNSYVPSGVISTLFDDNDIISSNFANAILINNHSNVFIKDTKFETNLTNFKEKENVVNIVNVNQAKLNGINLTISASSLDYNNIVTVNSNNSQVTIQSEQLSSFDLQLSRSQTNSFFNFPSPNDVEDIHIIPMLISNGQRTIWSQKKYGYILGDKIQTIDDFLTYVPHNLNGQSFYFIVTPNTIDKLSGLSSYYNGSLTLYRRESKIENHKETKVVTFDELNLDNCNIKLTLSGFNFRRLNIKNCSKVYLKECSFLRKIKDEENTTIPEVNMNYSIYEWKKSNTDWVSSICLDIDNSKVFIQNDKTDLAFNNFFIGVKANHNSEVFLNSIYNSVYNISLNQNLSNYSIDGNRPVFLLACNGSRIYSNYENINVTIQYPDDEVEFYGYKPSASVDTFVVNNSVKNISDKNYKRNKSLLIAIFEEVNNSKVYIKSFVDKLNRNKNKFNDYSDFNKLDVAIPTYGLFQVAKPYTEGEWTSNKNYHILSGLGSKNGLCDETGRLFKNEIFTKYGLSTVLEYDYNGLQPHLAHYFTAPEATSGIIQMAIQNDKTNTASGLVLSVYQKEK